MMKKHLSLLLVLVLGLMLALSAALAAEGDVTVEMVNFFSGKESNSANIIEYDYILADGRLPEKPASFVPVSPEWIFVGWEYYDVGQDVYVIGKPGEKASVDTVQLDLWAVWDDGKNPVFLRSSENPDMEISERVKRGDTYTLPPLPAAR